MIVGVTVLVKSGSYNAKFCIPLPWRSEPGWRLSSVFRRCCASDLWQHELIRVQFRG